jgi:hypothetical protein
VPGGTRAGALYGSLLHHERCPEKENLLPGDATYLFVRLQPCSPKDSREVPSQHCHTEELICLNVSFGVLRAPVPPWCLCPWPALGGSFWEPCVSPGRVVAMLPARLGLGCLAPSCLPGFFLSLGHHEALSSPCPFVQIALFL